jgi:hypothetical protein
MTILETKQINKKTNHFLPVLNFSVSPLSAATIASFCLTPSHQSSADLGAPTVGGGGGGSLISVRRNGSGRWKHETAEELYQHLSKIKLRSLDRPPTVRNTRSRVECRQQCCTRVALVRQRTIPTERQPLVSEISANFCV